MHKKDHMMAAAQDTRRKSEDGLWETVKVIIQALLIAFVVRTFLYQPFNIPSASMYPTLKVGDYLFVSKLSYGYGRYSFNFSLGLFGHEIVSCCPSISPAASCWPMTRSAATSRCSSCRPTPTSTTSSG